MTISYKNAINKHHYKNKKPTTFWPIDITKTLSENNRCLKKMVYRKYGIKCRSARKAARYLWLLTHAELKELTIEKPMAPPTDNVFFVKPVFRETNERWKIDIPGLDAIEVNSVKLI